jgi:peptidoglycan/xylan/chitin deacetylase (PgdA/CDA1 family)
MLWLRLCGKYQRTVSQVLFRRPFVMKPKVPYISFTFDDFPTSALRVGGEILKRHGARGTYYAAFGLMEKDTPSGRIFGLADLPALISDRHELGCHTYAHCHSWETAPRVFEASILENRRALQQHLPGYSFRSFSYPISCPRPFTKRRAAGHFDSCRGGGQAPNVGVADLGNLRAFFLEKSRGSPQIVKDVIDRTQRERGWLVLATHDVCEQPTPFGCVPQFFEEIVQYAVRSGARVLPVGDALAEIRSAN